MACEQCGDTFKVRAYREKTARFCSRRCQALAARIRASAACGVCGKQFEFISSRCNTAKYCSPECRYKAQHIKGSITYSCRHCGRQFLGAPSHKRVYCSRACVNKATKENWSPTFATARRQMAKRGLVEKCQRCGFEESPEILGVHHRDRDRRNNAMENLEVLCPNCHSMEHAKHIAHSFRE